MVNVASKCGLTPQYEKLQALYAEHKDEGLMVLGIPCNQFGKQEPGTESEIKSFCQENYGVEFDMLSKVDVNGDNAAPLYKYAWYALTPSTLISHRRYDRTTQLRLMV